MSARPSALALAGRVVQVAMPVTMTADESIAAAVDLIGKIKSQPKN